MIRNWGRLLLAVALFVFCSACGPKDFDEGLAGAILQEKPMKLDGEQLILTDGQVSCGAENDLWESPSRAGDRTTARLLDKGRALGFYDDVVVREGGSQISYSQVRGELPLEFNPPSEIHDAAAGVKIVTVKVGARINHSCFPSALPIMGVRKGQFNSEAAPTLRYVQEGPDWKFDRIVH
jgi:hypothetical protein